MQCRILQILYLQEVNSTKEAILSRMERDRTDMTKLAIKLEKHSAFSEGKALGNIITGINADPDVNVQDLFSAGKETVTQMEGQAIFSYTYKQKAKDTCSIYLALSRSLRTKPLILLYYCFKDSSLYPNLESSAWMRFFIMNSHHIHQVSLIQRIFCSNQTKHNCLKQYENIYLHQKLLNWRQFQRLIIMSLTVVLFYDV